MMMETHSSQTVQTPDRISIQSNGTAVIEILDTEVLWNSTTPLNMNTSEINSVGFISFGSPVPSSGRIRLPNGANGAIKWESSPAGFDGEMYFDNDFNWFVDTSQAYKYWIGGFQAIEINENGIDMQLNSVTNARNIEVNTNTTTAGIRDVGFTADPLTPLEGELYYNTTSKVWRFYDGTSWGDLGSGGTTIPNGTATRDHLEWNGSAWVAQQNISFDNNAPALQFRNAIDTAFITFQSTTGNNLRIERGDLGAAGLELSSDSLTTPQLFTMRQLNVGGGEMIYNTDGTEHIFQLSNVAELTVATNNINVHNNSLTNFVGWTANVGQATVVDGSGEHVSLPLGDTWDVTVDGLPVAVISKSGWAFDAASPTDTFNMSTHKIINVTDPTNPQDAATKKYVDDEIAGVGGVTDKISEGDSSIEIIDTLGPGGSAQFVMDGVTQGNITNALGWVFDTNATFGGPVTTISSADINLGDNTTDRVTFGGSINSDVIPIDTSRDLGSPVFPWSKLWSKDGDYTGVLNVAGALDIHSGIDANLSTISNLADPTLAHHAATKSYVDAQVGGGSSPPFDDNQAIIQDEIDNTKTLSFNLSLNSTGDANLISSATTASRTWTLPNKSGTVALLDDIGATGEPILFTITTVTPQTPPTKTNIDASLTNVFEIALDRDIDLDIINPSASKFEMIHIVITQDATGNRTITWPGSVNGTPSINTTALSETTVSLFNMADGTWRFVTTQGGVINAVGITKLSELEIDVDKNWQNKQINNVQQIAFSGTETLGAAESGIGMNFVENKMKYNVALTNYTHDFLAADELLASISRVGASEGQLNIHATVADILQADEQLFLTATSTPSPLLNGAIWRETLDLEFSKQDKME